MSLSIKNFTSAFDQMIIEDPIFKALWDGTMAWGDIPGILDENPSKSFDSHDNISSSPDIIIPSYTHGIKTIITRNLPRDISVDHLRIIFEKYGPIKDIYIPKNMDKHSPYFGTIKGFALIKFLNSQHSAQAYLNLYGRLRFGKNNITLEFAKQDR
jgi:hypothetical protein